MNRRTGVALAIVGSLVVPLAVRAAEDPSMDSGADSAARFEALDANHDGWVTKAEATAQDPAMPYDRLLQSGDANKDGRLSRGEFDSVVYEITWTGPGASGGKDVPEALFVQWDTNRDDKLSLSEVPADRRAAIEQVLTSLGKPGGELTYEEYLRHFGTGETGTAHPTGARPSPTTPAPTPEPPVAPRTPAP